MRHLLALLPEAAVVSCGCLGAFNEGEGQEEQAGSAPQSLPGTPGGPSGPRPCCLPFTVGAAPVSFPSKKCFAAHSPCSPVPAPLSQHPEVFHMVGASLPRPYKLHTPGWSHCICLPLQLRSRSFGPLPATSPVSLTLSGVFLGHRAVLCVLDPLNVLMKVCLIR